jgi:hypothetical protein
MDGLTSNHLQPFSNTLKSQNFLLAGKCCQGNKRTPERFVGKEAIITTQCLNGWYESKLEIVNPQNTSK